MRNLTVRTARRDNVADQALARLPRPTPKGQRVCDGGSRSSSCVPEPMAFLDHSTPTITDGLELEESVCWALPGTWQTGRSGFHLNHLRPLWRDVDHPGAEVLPPEACLCSSGRFWDSRTRAIRKSTGSETRKTSTSCHTPSIRASEMLRWSMMCRVVVPMKQPMLTPALWVMAERVLRGKAIAGC